MYLAQTHGEKYPKSRLIQYQVRPYLLLYSDIKTEDGGREIIWLDVNKEKFGLIEYPKSMCDIWRNYTYYDQLVDLNGEVGYVCTKTMEFWLLNHKKEWVPHCRFKEKIVPHGFLIDVIGCWNKDGDILIKIISGDPLYAFYVYNLKSDVLHKTSLAGSGACPGVFMYSYTLSSIHDINTNSFSVKTTDVMKAAEIYDLFVSAYLISLALALAKYDQS
nr:hypothetical protein [Tanacetum cinerariifolium]